jgi:PAS domain S-box-containing protein
MDKPLNILFVEDSEDDTVLILRKIKMHYKVSSWERVDTPKTFEMAIDKKQWDLIISDQSMPYFNPLMALKILKKKGLDIPFILVSGTIGEEAAVDVLRAGAHDFIQKGNTARLIPAIERELLEAQTRAERRAAVASLRRSEETIRTLFNAMQDALFLVDAHGRMLAINKKGMQMLKMDEHDPLGASIFNHLHGDMARLRRTKLDEALATGQTVFFEEVHKGQFFENTILPIHVTSAKSTEFTIITRDVTQQRLARQLETDKARSELSEYLVSALPAFASMIPQEARNVLVANFTGRFERYVRPNFEASLQAVTGSKAKSDEVFKFYLSWLGGFFTSIGSKTHFEQDGATGHIYIKTCAWNDITSRNPILCLLCRGLCSRSFSWVASHGLVDQKSSIMGGDEQCAFMFNFKEDLGKPALK